MIGIVLAILLHMLNKDNRIVRKSENYLCHNSEYCMRMLNWQSISDWYHQSNSSILSQSYMFYRKLNMISIIEISNHRNILMRKDSSVFKDCKLDNLNPNMLYKVAHLHN